MQDFLGTTIRRTVSIPKYSHGESILAIVDIGGKLFNKDFIYQKFFEFGVGGVKNHILEEFIRRGGSKENFFKMLDTIQKRLEEKINKWNFNLVQLY